MAQPLVRTKEELYRQYNELSGLRREETDEHHLQKDTGLIKSYVLETGQHNGVPNIAAALQGTELQAEQLEEDLFQIRVRGQEFGYAEPLSSRYFVLHTPTQNDDADKIVKRVTKSTADLDAFWVAGSAFQLFLTDLIAPSNPHRAIRLKLDYQPYFEHWQEVEEPDLDRDDVDFTKNTDDVPAQEESYRTAHHWLALFRQTAGYFANTLPKYQEIDPTWQAIDMLRFPAQAQGGYELWSWGKMTYRAASFTDGRNQLQALAAIYERATNVIEQAVWFGAEPTQVLKQTYYQLAGSSVVFTFHQRLTHETLHNFIDITFNRGQGPFRLWGNPLVRGPDKFHVYGIDLHQWQKLYMELTPDRFLFVLPQGTCGNTVHRLMTNIQHYLDPAVRLTIGGLSYEHVIGEALLGGSSE